MSEDAHQIKTPRCTDIDELAKMVHDLEIKQGWVETNQEPIDILAKFIANQTGELGELWEAARRDELYHWCDKSQAMLQYGLPWLTSLEEEVADLLIRILGFCIRMNINPSYILNVKHAYNKTRKPRHGGKLA